MESNREINREKSGVVLAAPAGAFFPPKRCVFMKYMARGVNKRTYFVNFDLKNLNVYNAAYPNPYCRKKLNECV